MMTPNWISVGAFNLLLSIDRSEDKEITHEKGAGWWVGNRRTNGKYVKELLDFCLISLAYGDRNDYGSFKIAPDGEEMLKNPDFEPRIVQARRDDLSRRSKENP